jgi:hypothetical protein
MNTPQEKCSGNMKHFFKHLNSFKRANAIHMKYSPTNPRGQKKEENRFLRLLKANRNMHFSNRANENRNYSHLATPSECDVKVVFSGFESRGRYNIMGQ